MRALIMNLSRSHRRALYGGLCFLLTPILAQAQELDPTSDEESPAKPVPRSEPTAVPSAPPAQAPTGGPPPAVSSPSAVPDEPTHREDKSTDHDRVLGRWGLGFYGVSRVPVGDASPGGDAERPTVENFTVKEIHTPTLGVRYWFRPRMGLDGGLGLWFLGGSSQANSTSVDRQPQIAVLLHAGLPLVVDAEKHLTFLIIPEFNLGFSGSSRSPAEGEGAPPSAAMSGFRLDLGARAGVELHFGFLGMPRLTLEGSLGAFFTTQSASAEVGSSTRKESATLFTTSTFNNPWDIFHGNVAARYYF